MNEAEFKSPLPNEELLFQRLLAREELGRLPEFRLDLLRRSALKPLQAKQLLGKTAALAIQPVKGKLRHLHGHITQFERGAGQGIYDVYRIVLRPWLWQLTLGADCRVFQDKTVVQILDAIFAEYGSSGRVEKKLNGSFNTRPYTVQYRESDFAFVSRLMEEEGIYYFFKHEAAQHTLVLCNSPTGHQPVEGDKLAYGPALKGGDYREDLLDHWSLAHLLQSLKYTTTDYAAEAPTTDMKANAERTPSYPKPNDWEVFDYPGNHDDYAMGSNMSAKLQTGKDRAKFEVNRFESLHAVGTGVTPYRPLAVGMTFALTDHPDAASFLVTSSITEMAYGGYQGGDEEANDSTRYVCRFNCVPKEVAFLPQAVTPTPVVRGPQTAVVTGPKGDEIHTDKYGRVKVQFHWDREGKKDEKSSCWVRVAHPWAGKGFGMVALPRIGDEVVVEFLEGNPDRPLITGRVYNEINKHPWELPAQATVSGIRTHSSKGGGADNFNELRFDDKKGSEYVWMQAQKDYHRLVKNDAHDTVKNDRWSEVIKNSQTKIGENYTFSVGKVSTVSLKGDTHLKLGADLNSALTGALNVKVGGATAIKGDTSVALTSGASMDFNAGAGMNLTAASFMNAKAIKIVLDAGMELCIKAGASFITLNASGVTIQGPIVKINSGGAAGSAKEAAKASPPAPKEPGDQAKNEDPLAGGK
ncbi:MAG: type VI secretion system tip protein VgrG [Paucibacter sp.]|nr:type VI secretion system tip protein VgrG [Roseateles sp.]